METSLWRLFFDGNFKVISMPLDKVEEELIKNKDKYGDNKGIIREMLDLLKIYKKIRNQNEIFNCGLRSIWCSICP